MNGTPDNFQRLQDAGLVGADLPADYREVIARLSSEEVQVILDVASRLDAVAPQDFAANLGQRFWSLYMRF